MYKKPTNVILVSLISFFVFTNHTSAIILAGHTKYYTSEEIVVNNILEFVFSILICLSMLMLFVSVYKDCKNKKNNKNFSMIKFLFISFLSISIIFFTSILYAQYFVEHIYYFYPYYFTYIGIMIFLIPIYLFTKVLAKIFKLEHLVILSIFMIIFSLLSISGKQ